MRRLIEHQVAVRASGALNFIFNTSPGASASGLFYLLNNNLLVIFMLKNLHNIQKMITFALSK